MRRKSLFAATTIAALLTSTTLLHDAFAQANTQASALTDAYNASGQELLNSLSDSPGNIVLSPYSIGTAMAMTSAGARGDTEKEMSSVLKHHVGRDEIAAANGQVLATLNSYDHSAVAPTCPSDMKLTDGRCQASPDRNGYCPFSTTREGDRCMGGATFPPSASLLAANALMLLKTGAAWPEYAGFLKDKYAAELFQNASLSDINGWVARKTNSKIASILSKEEADAANAVILSAVYFKSRWHYAFSERLTKAEPFHVASTDQIQVAMMHQSGHYAVVARQDYRALRLPYIVPSLAFIVVLPNAVDGLAEVIRSIDAKEQAALLAVFRGNPSMPSVMLSLPRFKVESDLDLIPPFKKAGMKLPFDTHLADFSGMTGRPLSDTRLAIGLIKHRAILEVNEESTEAAAVSAVAMAPTGAAPAPPQQSEVFRVDHPFLFYVADNSTGAILFAGRVANPSRFAGPVAIQAPLPPTTTTPPDRPQPVRSVQAASIKEIFEKHGLLGTFAWDCNKPPNAQSNWYFVNRAVDPGHIQRDYMTETTTRGWYSILDKAEERSAGEIYVSGTLNGKVTDGVWRVEPGQMLQVEATQDGRKIVSGGKSTATQKDLLWLNKCSN